MRDESGDNFSIQAENGSFELTINDVFDYPEKTCYWGGYDTFSAVEIKSSNYTAKGQINISTGEIYEFYKQLQECYTTLEGKALLTSHEKNLEMIMTFNGKGHIKINGIFKAHHNIANALFFELNTDQSYLHETLKSLKNVYRKYGDNSGVSH